MPDSVIWAARMLLLAAQMLEQWDELQEISDLRMAGFFFFAMATYTLCPLLGVKAFALSPEKMIRFGLQTEATSFAFHLLIELALGWILVGLSYNQRMSERNLT